MNQGFLCCFVQAVNSGANSYICYGCASIVKNICYFSKPEMLQELLKDANIRKVLSMQLRLFLCKKIVQSLLISQMKHNNQRISLS
ncbi:Os05g0464001 [Oryza sativa Japonica Group]|uniref:Os05g0464001 protein n=1 Tax=Oryza sativa subsp. japonica TaxID=39947 RepID=A0A0P0WNB7_ORYSJ|nr:hypothetical protein EE612_030029 [Oryza sativa]BAS94436.1 Os05g0464001 [Oryza sativa Japonica Group]